MTFNSLQFALFLPIFLVIFYSIYTRQRLKDIFLLTGSYVFYMCWYWQYAGILLCSTTVDYLIGRQLGYESNPRNRRILLITSLTVNLGILALFKYYNFFYASSQVIFNLIGFSVPDMCHKLLLPIGISFYTFQTLSYTIDVYRKELEPEKSFVKFAVFVSFFPQLVAGPIVRAKDFLPQINNPVFVTSEHQETGWNLIFIGLAKKILIADLLAYMAVDAIFENLGAYSAFDLVIGLYAYTFQIYCDFSGYTDIAIGVALLLGFKLPINFNRPYLAQSPSDFWKRWHISLSSWLRDYLYISLGGNRVNRWTTYRNLTITMILGGLWHGAAWNFVLWGAFHGLILILFKNIVSEHQFSFKMIAKIFVNFHLIVFGWLLFRSTSVDTFIQYIDGVSKLNGGTVLNPLLYIILGIAAFSHFVPQHFYDRTIVTYFNNLALPLKSILYWGMLCLFVGSSVGTPVFIYFQF